MQNTYKKYHKQRGISLYVVIVLVLLSTLLALWASRTALFNEMIVGNDADYQRAFEAAQAMIQDAELDIQRSAADGSACVPDGAKPDQCRPVGTSLFFPYCNGTDRTEFLTLKAALNTLTAVDSRELRCSKGICKKFIETEDWWNDATTFSAMTATNVGARYGQFTGAKTGAGSNPILSLTSAGQGAWYWVEILDVPDNVPGLMSSASSPTFTKNSFATVPGCPMYRITSIALGLKSNTRAIVQSIFMPKPSTLTGS